MTVHTLRIHYEPSWDGIRSDCSCGEYIGFVAGELFHTLPIIAGREQARLVDQWNLHRPKPYFDPPAECTIMMQGGPEDGRKIIIPWEIYRRGVVVTAGPMEFTPPLTAATADKEPVYTVEQRTYTYTPDWRNPLIWSC